MTETQSIELSQTTTHPTTRTNSAITNSSSEEENIQALDLAPSLSHRTNIISREDVPPDGGYGWICCICVFLINAHTWGVNSSWAIFLSHFLHHNSFPGATQLEYALIGGMSISQSLFISPLVGVANDKIGTRPTLAIGTVLVAVSMFTASYSTQIWHLFLNQGVCFGWGMGFLYITATPVLGQWFGKKRSLAVGIASSGAGFGGLAYNLAAGAGVEALGVRWTYRILALTTLVVNAACSILLKDRKQHLQTAGKRQKTFNLREFRHISVVLIIFWGWFTELGYIVLLYSLPSYARSIGLSAKQGSVVGAVLNLGLAFGRPIVGFLSDKLGRIDVATAMTAFCGICCLAIWVPANNYPILLVFALLSGTATGTFWGTVVPVTAEVVGLQRLPSAFGMLCMPLVVPTVFAEPIALQLVSSRGYLSAKVFVGCMFLAGAASTWALRSWKICEIEEKERRERILEEETYVKEKVWLTPRRLFMNKRV